MTEPVVLSASTTTSDLGKSLDVRLVLLSDTLDELTGFEPAFPRLGVLPLNYGSSAFTDALTLSSSLHAVPFIVASVPLAWHSDYMLRLFYFRKYQSEVLAALLVVNTERFELSR